jgi:hypothetical protein
MALTRSGAQLVFGTGDINILSKSTQKRYGSEVEVVKGDGETHDVIYSGAESMVTTTKIQDAIEVPDTALGTGNIGAEGVLMRVSVQASNEDLVRVEEERLQIDLS